MIAMINLTVRGVTALIGVFLLTQPGLAATETQLDALQQCRALQDAPSRLRCYDTAVDRLTLSMNAGDTVVMDRQQVRQARKGLFGFVMPKIPFLTGRAGNAQDAADEQRLETVITASRELGHGNWLFTVEGGAEWQTTETATSFQDPAPGIHVLIEKGSLGGYFAKIGRGRRVQAKRVR